MAQAYRDLHPHHQCLAASGPLPVSFHSSAHLSYGIGRQDLVLHVSVAAGLADGGEVPHGIAGGHCLSSSRLPTHNN